MRRRESELGFRIGEGETDAAERPRPGGDVEPAAVQQAEAGVRKQIADDTISCAGGLGVITAGGAKC